MASTTQIIRRRHKRRQRSSDARATSRNWTLVLLVLIVVFLALPAGVVFSSVFAAYARALSILPQPQATTQRDAAQGATVLYDATGETLLFTIEAASSSEPLWLALDDLPETLITATLLWEDPTFLENERANLLQTVDMLVSNWLAGPVEAEPSLTRRLVRNAILPVPGFRDVEQAGTEIALIAEIERLYSPEAIIEWHLNTNYYGNEAYGIEAAAQTYLGKTARELTLDEAALLAAIPTAPRFNPADDETAARGRQADLLRRMLTTNQITQSQFEQALSTPTPILVDAGQRPLLAPEFAIYARRQAETLLNEMGMDGTQLVSRGGLQITTTLDLDLYLQAECTLQTHLARLERADAPTITAQDGSPCSGVGFLPLADGVLTAPPDSGGIVVLDTRTGVVRAIVGPGTRVGYQPGPVLHPFVYLDGFLKGSHTAATMLLDIPRDFPGVEDGLLYLPNNVDGLFRGPLSLRQAMSISLLPPAVQTANVLNLNNIIRDTFQSMGIRSLRDGLYDLSLLDRGGAVSVMEMTYAYSIFGAMGIGTRGHMPIAIQRIEDANGEVLWVYDDQNQAQQRIPIMDQEVAYMVNDILADASSRRVVLGQNNPLETLRRTAVVNGITGNRIDNWTIGYTPQHTIGVHLGRADGMALSLEGFATEGAATVWRAVMDYMQQRDALPAVDWPRPARIVQVPVCEVSGLSPNGACDTRPEIFLDASLIPPQDTYWEIVRVNTQNGLLATANTATALVDSRRYFSPPDEALNWWQANNRPLPPTEYDILSRADIFSSAAILQPRNLEIVGGVVDVRGIINTAEMRFYQLSYGAGLIPQSWSNITEQEATFIDGTSLGLWDTAGLNDTYTLRLQVTLNDNTLETATIQVIVDNIPPSVILTTDEPGRVFRWPTERIIPLLADVADNIRLDRVEFYHNGEFVGSVAEFPYAYNHPINRAGLETFTAVAFDAVGNSSQAEITVEVIREGG